ncbi:MAG: DUF2207 domain-containing protein [Clostridiales bacterium]|nr:DUF2207 domain-containing protein [Clostridiales bacterium]
MRKKCILSIFLIVCSSMFFFAMPAMAASDSGYDITAYHTEIHIEKNNTYHITETITVNFNEPRHGIYRTIPSKQVMTWYLKGTVEKRTYNTRIKSIVVEGAPFKSYSENGNVVIQIGDPEELISGKKSYKISYEQILGDDKINSLDFVNYNLVGTGWDSNINNVSFSVGMPKNFDAKKVWFFSGAYGSSDKAPVQYSISGNTITGSLKGALGPNEGLTLQVDLPEGYFEVPAPFPWQAFLIVAALLSLALSILLFLRYGKDERLIKTVEFYAPEGITSAEAGYIIDSSADEKDVVSLILYWASKGYLSIDRTSKEDFLLTKNMELSEDAHNFEKHMFRKLFEGRDRVFLSQLKENFYTVIDTTKDLIADHYSTKENRLYSPGSRALGWSIRLLSYLLVWASLFVTTYDMTYAAGVSMIGAFIGTGIVILPSLFMGRTLKFWQSMRRVKRSATLIAVSIFMVVVLLVYIAYMTIQKMGMAGFVIAIIFVLMNILGIFMSKRTKRGSELLGKLLGFKNFIERAEKSRIERLVEENPSYFYDVMPFAYVLGVTDKWAKNFEGIAIRPPEWYRDTYDTMGPFSPFVFQTYMFHSMAAMRIAMASRPVQQMNTGSGFGGGSFGGGGFSGGGFGGGGGGSW